MASSFKHYTAEEAESTATRFIEAFAERSRELADVRSTAEWTETVLDWFADTAPRDGVVVDAHRPKRLTREIPAEIFHPVLAQIAPPSKRRQWSRERMVDLAHHRFLAYDDARYGRGHAYWGAAYGSADDVEMLLALENESGRCGSPALNSHRVLEDASKLVALAARVKVVVFGSNSAEEREAILRVGAHMVHRDYTVVRAANSGDRPTWLWLDLPWASWTTVPPTAWTGRAGSDAALRQIPRTS